MPEQETIWLTYKNGINYSLYIPVSFLRQEHSKNEQVFFYRSVARSHQCKSILSLSQSPLVPSIKAYIGI